MKNYLTQSHLKKTPLAVLTFALFYSALPIFGQVTLPQASYTFTDITAPTGTAGSGFGFQVFGLNDHNQFVALTSPSPGAIRSFVNDGGASGGAFSELLLSGYHSTVAYDVNNLGQVVGGVGVPSTSALAGFVYDPAAGFTLLPIPPGEPNFSAMSINNAGVVVGGSHTGTDRVRTYSGGSFAPISIPGEPFMYSGGINDLNEVAGYYYHGRFYGYRATASGIETLDIAGATSVEAFDINNAGAMVGLFTYLDGGNQRVGGFILEGSTYSEVMVPGAYNTYVSAINNHGTIIGYYQETANSPFKGYMATPSTVSSVPDPASTATLVGFASLLLLFCSRRVRVDIDSATTKD